MGNSADVISANTHAEGLSTHAWQCMAKFANFTFAPNFYLWTDLLVTRSRDAGRPYGSPIEVWEESSQGNGSCEFLKFPIVGLWENDHWRATC